MKRVTLGAFLLMAVMAFWPLMPSESLAGTGLQLNLGGGPSGSAMTHAANAVAILLSRSIKDLEVSSQVTLGSRANLKRLREGSLELGIVLAGDTLPDLTPIIDSPAIESGQVCAVAGLYRVPAQLAVLADSSTMLAQDLRDKRICVGSPGSSTALVAERLFSALGWWDSMEKLHLGHAEAAQALREGRADAMLLMDGLPSKHLLELASTQGVRFIDLHQSALVSGFYDLGLGYAPVNIPAGTYPGQTKPITTFADTAWLCAMEMLPAQVVRDCLAILASTAGLEHLSILVQTAEPVAKLAQAKPLLPLHPGVMHSNEVALIPGATP
ncbi:TAXI family TRAP transporter solute-binding subunit [Desulfocurvibacter africanus]|uniref:TAXI family TRAP transporter solute-binding subunit n=1 Tax=Desulfocurvibacter africanus TaxID=873 RepID=UPI0004844E62|nr:TAXI family TRAP transporter solute-binding subunit [Desulfocurvibacter africanus]